MKRNQSIDLLRSLALLLVMTRHCWVLTGYYPINFHPLSVLIQISGEIGVVLFFMLSGFGIYLSIESMIRKTGSFDFKTFMKARLKRVCPQYFVCIFTLLLITNQADNFGSMNGFWNIVTHALFIHNWFGPYRGAIDGSLWTMGVTVQFYLIAYPLYLAFKKWGAKFWAVTALFTIAMKAIAYAIVLPGIENSTKYYFMAGRQLPTALDNFTTGMLVAYVVLKMPAIKKLYQALLGALASAGVLFALHYEGLAFGIHTNNIGGYTWHTLISIALGLVMYFVYYIPCTGKHFITKVFLWIADCEYATYIWHIVIFENLILNAPLVYDLMTGRHPKLAYVPLVVFSLLFGGLMTQLIEPARRKNK